MFKYYYTFVKVMIFFVNIRPNESTIQILVTKFENPGPTEPLLDFHTSLVVD